MRAEQIHRYARHISLGSVGARGQERVLDARVAIQATGDAASHCALVYLAASGVGHIALRGGDQVVTESEVTHSLLFRDSDIGRSRFEAFAEAIAALNPDVALSRAAENAEFLEVGAADSLAEGLETGCAAAASVVYALAQGTP